LSHGARLSQETKTALFYHAWPRPHGFDCEALRGKTKHFWSPGTIWPPCDKGQLFFDVLLNFVRKRSPGLNLHLKIKLCPRISFFNNFNLFKCQETENVLDVIFSGIFFIHKCDRSDMSCTSITLNFKRRWFPNKARY